MSAGPLLADWGAWLFRLALGSTALVVVAAAGAWWLRRAARLGAVPQRTVWRALWLAVALFAAIDMSGIGNIVIAWLRETSVTETQAFVNLSPRGARALPALDSASREGFRRHRPEAKAELARAVDAAEQTAVWWPGLLWLAGTGLLLGRVVVGRGLLLALRRRCRRLHTGPLVEGVYAVAAKLGLRRTIVLVEAPTALGPAAFGAWRPTLVLPPRFADDFDAAKQNVMLAHELAHLAAADPVWQAFSDVVVAALWWQPLLWWAKRQHRGASEAAADEASLVLDNGPALLATCLVEMGGRLAAARRPGWLAMADGGYRSCLGRRVERLLGLGARSWQPPRRARAGLFLLCAPLLLAGGAILSTSWVHSQTIPEGGISMNAMRRSWRQSLAGLVLLSTVGVGAEPAWATPPQKEPGAQAGARGPTQLPATGLPGRGGEAVGPGPALAGEGGEQAGDQHLKIFRLKHREPEAIANIASMLMTGQNWFSTLGPEMSGVGESPGAEPGGLPLGPGQGAIGLGPRGVGVPRGAGEGAIGFGMPGIAAGGPMPGAAALWNVRFAADKRTRTLIVRGDKRDLQLIADLVAILDLEDGKTAPKAKHLQVFKLRHTDPRTVRNVALQLDIQTRLAPDPQGRMLIVMGEPAEISELSQVIEALDVESAKKK